MKHAILVLFLFLGNASAATYYIDYSGGSDSNNGTAKATPWKHSPFMQPFSGSYTHVSGNDFVYKGGVTWPRAAVPSVITGGGTSGNHSTHGVDVTWYNGGSFTKPIFTSGGLTFTNNSIPHLQNMFRVLGTSTARVEYVDFDNLIAKQWGIQGGTSTLAGGWGFTGYRAGNIRITDCEVRDWEPIFSGLDEDGAKIVGSGGGFGCFSYVGTSGTPDIIGYSEIIDSVIQGPLSISANCLTGNPDQLPPSPTNPSGGGFTSGSGVRNVTLARNCVITRVSQGIFTVAVIEGNEIFDMGADKTATTHENAIRPTSHSAIIRGNWVHDTARPATQTMWGQICAGGTHGRYAHVYNNIFGPNVGDSIVGTGDGNVADSQNEYWFYNNLVIGDRIYNGVAVPSRGQPFSGPTIVANNLCISDTLTVATAFPIGEPSDFLDVHVPRAGVDGSNKVITTAQANAAGMTLARKYKPNQAIAGVTNGGVTLSGTNPWGAVGGNIPTFNDDYEGTTRAAPWSVGPYEFGGTPVAIPGNIQLTSDTYSTPEGTNVTITASRGGGDDGAVGVSWATSNTSPVSATAGTDYTAASGTFSWANGDSANKTTTITIAQDATSESSESFLFTISSPTGGATLDSPTQAIVTIVDDDSAPTIPLMPGLTFDVEDMLIDPPFVNTSGLIDQPVQTTTPSSGGRALARVTIPSAGNYRVAMNVNANSTSSDSLFIDFDGEPATPTAIWDVLPATTGTAPQPRNVSWRGTGTFTAPQFVDKEWTLSAGEHILFIRGREANMDLQSVTIFSTAVVDATPPTPNPTTIAEVEASSVSVIIESEVAADITGPVQYQFEVIGTNGVGSFTTSFQDGTSTSATLFPGRKYTVRTRTQDGATPPNVGEWSAPEEFEVPTIEGTGARRR